MIKPGEDLVEPMLLFVLVPGFFVGVNVCYTAGWFLELFARRYGTVFTPILRVRLFQLGLIFSAFVIFLPSVLLLALWLFFRSP